MFKKGNDDQNEHRNENCLHRFARWRFMPASVGAFVGGVLGILLPDQFADGGHCRFIVTVVNWIIGWFRGNL